MKFIISIPFIFLQFILYSQNMMVKYNIESSFKTSLPIPGAPRSVKAVIEIINDGEHFLMNTSLKKDSTQKIFSAGDNTLLASIPNSKIYAFDINRHITDVYFLRRDTLIGAGVNTKIRNIPCQVYNLKGNPNVKVYANKKLDKKINPGLDYYYPKPLGGIVKIEIEIPRATIVYQLASFEETIQRIDLYVSKTKTCNIIPAAIQSILLKQ